MCSPKRGATGKVNNVLKSEYVSKYIKQSQSQYKYKVVITLA